jgi:hypothetical protein
MDTLNTLNTCKYKNCTDPVALKSNGKYAALCDTHLTKQSNRQNEARKRKASSVIDNKQESITKIAHNKKKVKNIDIQDSKISILDDRISELEKHVKISNNSISMRNEKVSQLPIICKDTIPNNTTPNMKAKIEVYNLHKKFWALLRTVHEQRKY